MITIICGQDLFASRQKLNEIRLNSGFSEKIIFSSKELNPQLLKQEISNSTLFSTKKLLIIEDFFSQKKISFKIFESLDENIDLVLWQSGDLPRRIKLGKNVNVIIFKQKQIIFKYLDSLLPQNRKMAFNFLFKIFWMDIEDSVVFYLLVRHLRLLAASKFKGTKDFFDLENQADWMREKNLRNAKCFDFLKLKIIYELLCEADFRLKTGRLENLKQTFIWATYQLTAQNKKR